MARLERWFHAAIEAAAECKAYPAYVPREATVPFVHFARSSTEREHDMMGNIAAPVATLDVAAFAETYLGAKQLAERIRLAVDNFSGAVDGLTIEQTRLIAERDGEPVFVTGEDVPTYVAELTFDVRYIEEI